MSLAPRKLVTIITEAAIEKKVVEQLETLKVTGYTITDARGKGSHGIRNSSWDMSANIRIEIVCDDKTASNVTNNLKKDYYKDYAMIVFLTDVEVMRPEKF